MKLNPFKKKTYVPVLTEDEKQKIASSMKAALEAEFGTTGFEGTLEEAANFEFIHKETHPVPTNEWLPAAGYDGIDILIEHPVIVQVRKGTPGSRVYGKYRVAAEELNNLDDFIADRVAEFNDKEN